MTITNISSPAGAVEFRAVTFGHGTGGPPVFESLTLYIPAGSFWLIQGPNGAGKSTLLDLIARLKRPQAGQVRVGGQHVEYLPQDYVRSLFPWHDVAWNICLPLLVKGHFRTLPLRRPALGAWEWPVRMLRRGARQRAAMRGAAHDLCVAMGVELPLAELAGRLSGGQKHLVTLLRSFAGRPDILLLDEPDAGLDRINTDKLWAALCRYKEAHPEVTIVCVSHDIPVELPVSHARWRMSGRPAAVQPL